jgi:archaemetzincin
VSFIYLAPSSGVEGMVLDVMEPCLSNTFGLRIRRLEPLSNPKNAYDPQRHQYSSTEILRMLKENLPPDALRLLGIVDRDIFIPMLTFIFGQAQLGGAVALISLARLRQEFYGLPPDPDLLLERARKEAIHELGHTFGLIHCRDHSCTMSLSTSIEQVDAKAEELCAPCRRLLRESMRALDRIPGHRRDAEEEK